MAGVDEGLLRELARPIVARFAPAEVELLFPVLSEAYFDDPAAYGGGTVRPGPLAFGLPEAAVLLTPVLLMAFNEVVQYIVGQGMAAGVRVSGRAIRRLFPSSRGEAAESAGSGAGEAASTADEGGGTAPAVDAAAAGVIGLAASQADELVLTPAQWGEISRIVERVAQRGGVDADLARLIAAAVVGEGQLGRGRG